MSIILQAMTDIRPNTTLELSGIIPYQAERIRLGLGTNWNNLAFYMEVRFNKDPKEIVFNTRTNGKWGTQQNEDNPFNRGGKFEVSVNFTAPQYTVHINDKVVNFPNHTDIHETPMIMIGEDLELTSFSVKHTSGH